MTEDTFSTLGIPTLQDLNKAPGIPHNLRMEKGPVAFIECLQEIPCNPCESSCPHGAIKVGTPITNLPKLDSDKCIGCGLCITACPGLAIFKIHLNYTQTTSLIEFPYEFYPLVTEGEKVCCANRLGQFITEGIVHKVNKPKCPYGTFTLSVEVPRKYWGEVRMILRRTAND